jgi:RNA polymerase sigma-70 factor (ECF subfamily)
MDLSKVTKQAYEQLFKSCYTDLCRISLKLLRDPNLSEEVVQEVFVRIWEKRDVIHCKNWKGYLFKSVINASIETLRKQKSISISKGLFLDNKIEYYKQQSPMELSELEKYIEKALMQLPKKCYKVFALKRFYGFTTIETAAKLNISAKTVENQFTIALRKIRIYLRKHDLL